MAGQANVTCRCGASSNTEAQKSRSELTQSGSDNAEKGSIRQR